MVENHWPDIAKIADGLPDVNELTLR